MGLFPDHYLLTRLPELSYKRLVNSRNSGILRSCTHRWTWRRNMAAPTRIKHSACIAARRALVHKRERMRFLELLESRQLLTSFTATDVGTVVAVEGEGSITAASFAHGLSEDASLLRQIHIVSLPTFGVLFHVNGPTVYSGETVDAGALNLTYSPKLGFNGSRLLPVERHRRIQRHDQQRELQLHARLPFHQQPCRPAGTSRCALSHSTYHFQLRDFQRNQLSFLDRIPLCSQPGHAHDQWRARCCRDSLFRELLDANHVHAQGGI